MMFERFENLLKQAMGLDAASIGTSAVERAVQTRTRACGLADCDLYWAQVSTCRVELQALVEAVVVPETWFFRDRQAFAAMARLAVEEWLPMQAQGAVLRLLSLPCSTGEEPYTMAMALLDAGLPANAFRIDAIDISGPALEQAASAVYGRNSFRGNDLDYRDRHFTKAGSGYRLADAVRAPVRFRQGNLFEAAAGGETYDMVFCRNVLIYFDAHDQRRAVGVLRRLLTPSGILFVGHSEASLLLGEGFASAQIPLAFAFRKAAATPRRVKPAPVWQPKAIMAGPAPKAATPSPATTRKIAVPASVRNIGVSLDEIRRAASRGDLTNAVKQGETYLRANEATPEALHLMGVISDAAGDLRAADAYYRKALYLDPEQDEVLTHLALLLEKQGEVEGARLTRDRARRLRERKAG